MTTTHSQLNTQMTTDISLIGLTQNALGQATTKHAREFKEAWHSLDKQTFNRHIDSPLIFLQLTQIFNLINFLNTYPTFYRYYLTNNQNDDRNMYATNDHQAENRQPIRRSRRLQHRHKEREDLKHSFSDEDSKYRVESSKL